MRSKGYIIKAKEKKLKGGRRGNLKQWYKF